MRKLTEKKIGEVITEAIGSDAAKIAGIIGRKRDVSEFKIAESLGEDIQIVRNILYRLHSRNLVSYKRKKDNKKGWYVSYWTFSKQSVAILQNAMQREKLEKFRERLHVECTNINTFFICPKACTRMDFYNSSSHQFRCPECGSLMQQQDNAKTIDFLKAKIKEMEAVAST